MDIKELYDEIIAQPKLWKYYNNQIENPNINDPTSCRYFIEKYLEISGKFSKRLKDGIDYIFENDRKRLIHIVSTFFLGIALYNNEELKMKEPIKNELKQFPIFKGKTDIFIDKHFIFIWFMTTLCHDLGYQYEKGKKCCQIRRKNIIKKCSNLNSIPPLYFNIIGEYHKYREKKDHGICAGYLFDTEICTIRKKKEMGILPNDGLDWDKRLNKVYHSVSQIIMGHNIWFIRERSSDIKKYRNHELFELILPNDKSQDSYPIKFNEYPLFFLFCLVDSIEPTKSTNLWSEVEISFEGQKINITTNDSFYFEKINDINNWLIPIHNMDIETNKKNNLSIQF